MKIHERLLVIAFQLLPLLAFSQHVESGEFHDVYKSFSAGFSGGTFYNEIVYGKQYGNPWSWESHFEVSGKTEFKQKFGLVTFGYSITKIKDNPISIKSSLNYGVNCSLGYITEENLTSNESKNKPIIFVNPFVKYDLTWIGLGVGFHLGINQYAYPKSNYEKQGIPETGLGNSIIYPQFHLRVGPKRFFALEYNFTNYFPSAIPVITHSFSYGSGFGFRNGLYLRYSLVFGSTQYYDLDIHAEKSGSFLSGYIPINKTFVLEPFW